MGEGDSDAVDTHGRIAVSIDWPAVSERRGGGAERPAWRQKRQSPHRAGFVLCFLVTGRVKEAAIWRSAGFEPVYTALVFSGWCFRWLV